MAVMPESTSARVHDSLAARCRYVNSTCPRRIRGYSSATGSLTLQTRSASAHTSSAAPRICAPAATKSSSGMDEPAPASFSTTTVWPRTVSSCTPDGVMATRYSLSLTSRGTPTRTAHLFRLGRAFAPPRSLGAHELLFPALRARRSIRGCVEEMSDFAQPRRTPVLPLPRIHPSRPVMTISALGVVSLAAATLLPVSQGQAHAASFGTPVVVSGDDVSEPGIDVAPDGTLYVNAPVGVLSNIPGSPSMVYRSTNGGASWTALPQSLKANLPGGGDSDITIAPDGTLSETDLWLGNSTVATSSDKGQTWTANPVQGPLVQDRQWVAATSGGRVYHVVHQIPTGLWVARSVDSGLTSPQQVVAATALDQTGCICPPGNIVSEDGGLLADKVGGVYATSVGGVGFYRSTNGGLTFTNTTPGLASSATTNVAFPVVADGGNGTLAVVWQGVDGNTSTVWFTTSNDFGATWAAPRQIVTSGTSLYPWIAYHGSKIAISLYHSDSAGTPDTVPASAQWFESYLESADGGATFSALQSADPTPVKTGPVCTGGINCASNRELGDFQQVALDGSDRAVLSYVRSIDNASNTEIRFVREG